MTTTMNHLGRSNPYPGKEEDLQASCAKWLAYAWPTSLAFHVPNGGDRNRIVAAKLKAQGTRPGVADFIFLEPRRGYPGLIIELKVKKGRLSDHQRAFLMAAQERGYFVAIVWNMDAFMEVVDNYLI